MVACGVLVLLLFTAPNADAQCPDPVEPTFPWISEVPYGDLPTIDVMYRPQFLFSYQPTDEFNAGALPWVEDPSFYCAENCPCDADPEPGCDVETNGWSVQNECPNLADEPMTEETDWYSTAGPSGTYNCIAYAMGRTDVWLQGNCDEGASAGPSYDLTWMNVVARDYGYRPATHCFPECGKRKVVAFGRLDPAAYRENDPWSFFDVMHAAVEVGDSGWLESKFGPEPRLLHKLFDLSGGCMGYGGPMACWERDVEGANPTLCDPGYDPFEDPANQVPAEICDRWGWENYLFCRADFCAQAPNGCPADDADLDGIPFANDSCPGVVNTLEDRDADGIDDACDNCIDVQNPDQANCDLEFDDAAPSDRRGDACDPDPCAVWHAPNGRPLRSSVEDMGGDAAVGRVAYFSFDGLGGDINLAAADNYRANETFQDVRPAYCSCAQSQDPEDCEADCRANVPLSHDPITGKGWWVMSREVDGDIVREEMADVPFVRGGPGGGAGGWRWQQDDCPGAGGQRVDCSTLGNQKFHLWLRPMVDPASWPDGWPDELHNYYAPGEYRLDAIILPNPPPEAEWPGPRFLPEGACFHCDLGFFGEAMLPFVGEFAPGTPLPPYSPYRFAGYSSGDPVQGIALGLIDPDTLTVRRYIPSRGLTSTHEPRVTGAMVAVAPPAGTGFDATLWLFGGIGAGGVRSGALFRGDVVAGSTPSLDRVVWTRLTPSSAPSGRVGGMFAYEPIRHSLLLWGGLDGAGHALDDFWRFDIGTGTWSRDSLRSMPDARPGRRAFGAAGQDGQFVYVYGGQRTDGAPLDDLYRVDLVSAVADLVDQSCSGASAMLRAGGGQFLAEFATAEGQEPYLAALDEAWDDALVPAGDGLAALTSSGPGPRSAADLAVAPDHRGLLLYGGVTTAGTSNELWRFDLQTHCWEPLSGPCTSGSCLPAGSQALAAGASARTAVLIPSIAGELRPSIAWHFDPARAARSPGWVPESEWAGQPAAADCNGDGYPDTGAGFACATSTSWYDAPGARGCTDAGAVACPQVTASLDGLYSLSATSPVKIAARGETLVLSSGRWVRRYRVVDGAAPVLTGVASLSGSAVGIVLDGPRAFVATTSKRVQVFSLAGGGITYQGQRTFSSTVGAIGGDGHRVYVASGNRLWVLDGSSDSLPTVGWTTLPQSSSTALAVVGRNVVVANGTVIVVVSVVTPSAPTVQGSLTIGSGTTALRTMDRRVYAINSALNYVIDVSNPSVPALVGMHDALEWARGAQYVGGHAVRVSGTSLVQVAQIQP